MKKRTKIVTGVIGLLVVVSISTFFFLRYQIIKSFPKTSGAISLAGLTSSVEILRDEYGVPTIVAANEQDLFIAIGYVHAQDRLWQMDMSRRVGEGRLSELFGDVTIPFDRMFRIVGLKSVSEEIEKSISVESHQRLVWYSVGVNSFIDSHRGKFPIEFDLLSYEPEPWQPVHSILIGRLMAWELNMAWWTDITFGAIVERVGGEKGMEILPSYPAEVPPIVPSAHHQKITGMLSALKETSEAFRNFMGQPGFLGGSNAWVVGKSKSTSNQVILANDVHLQLHTPSKWYEANLVTPNLRVGGASVPGIPGIVLGRNEKIAWGLTNVMADDADFYIEMIDSSDTTKYLYDGEWRNITFRQEEIRVKDDSSFFFEVRATHHGPIVTDIATPLKRANAPFVASMRWTGYEMSDQIEAFYKINRATDPAQFAAGVREFSGPGQNFVYGDIEGNIGYWCGMMLPIRTTRQSNLPLPGWEKSSEWQGFVPFEQLPHLLNPPEGFIATANNKIVDDNYPHHISDLWEPPSRVIRLREVLSRDEVFSAKDFERLQTETYSAYAHDLTPFVIAACEEDLPSVPDGELLLSYFRNWDHKFEQEDIVTTLYQEFLIHLLRNTFADEMGDELFHDYVVLVNVPLRVIAKMVKDGTSTWFDNTHTDRIEFCNEIIRASMADAVRSLQARLGSDMKKWRWGDVHTVTLQHPFGLRKPLDKIFNVGPYPYRGGSTSLISGEYSFNNPFAVTVGASFRHIVDMSKPALARVVYAPGQSGQVLHRNYDDQVHLWLNGMYRNSGWRTDDPRIMEKLTLEPLE